MKIFIKRLKVNYLQMKYQVCYVKLSSDEASKTVTLRTKAIFTLASNKLALHYRHNWDNSSQYMIIPSACVTRITLHRSISCSLLSPHHVWLPVHIPNDQTAQYT